jgi:large subunit ribosomal protein L25
MSKEVISLTLEPRDVTGKAVKHLRNVGTLPAVIHDHGKASLVVQGNAVALYKAYQKAGRHHPIEVTSDGKKYTALIKTATFDPRKNQLSHVVFNAVTATEKVEAEVPIHPHYAEGNDASPAERSSLIVLANLESVNVSAIASKLPDFLSYDAEKLVEIGDHVTVADLTVPEGVTVLTEPEHTIATVYEPSALAAANDAAGGAEEESTEVPSDNGSPEDDADSQAPEDKPGGAKQAEPKGE